MTAAVNLSELDATDLAIAGSRIIALERVSGPRCGDFVRYPDGHEERISHLWEFHPDDEFESFAQTSEDGSFYLGHGYVSFSGGLNPGVPIASLRLTDETKPGRVWMFHHDHRRAHNGVDFEIVFRVYEVAA